MQSKVQISDTIPKRQRVVLVVAPAPRSRGGAIARMAAMLNAEIATRHNFHFVQIPRPDGLTRTSPLSGAVSQAVATADMVWLHDTLSLNSYAAFRAARKFNKPVLVTQHSSPVSSSIAARIDRAITQKILGAANQAIFTNDNVATYYCDRVIFSAPAKIITNGVDLQTFQMPLPEKRQVLRSRFALRDNQPVLLFCGPFTDRAGLPVIRMLAEQLPYWRFWLAGDGPMKPEEWFLPNLQTFRKRSTEQFAELYQAADLLIAPGCGRQSSTVLQEALACGLPVLCSPAMANSNIVIKPVLLTADIIAGSPRHTAQLWAAKLNLMRSRNDFPLSAPKGDLAGMAEGLWGWPQISECYAEILGKMSP